MAGANMSRGQNSKTIVSHCILIREHASTPGIGLTHFLKWETAKTKTRIPTKTHISSVKLTLAVISCENNGFS